MTKYITSLLFICTLTAVMGDPAPSAEHNHHKRCPQPQRPIVVQPHCPSRRPIYIQPYCPPRRTYYSRYYYQQPRTTYYNSYRPSPQQCDEYIVQLYSKGQMVNTWIAVGSVGTTVSSDGIRYFFTAKYTGQSIQIDSSAGSVVIKRR